MDDVVDMYVEAGVDRLATWTYRGGYGTSVAAPDPIKLWDKIGENYKRVLNKYFSEATYERLRLLCQDSGKSAAGQRYPE